MFSLWNSKIHRIESFSSQVSTVNKQLLSTSDLKMPPIKVIRSTFFLIFFRFLFSFNQTIQFFTINLIPHHNFYSTTCPLRFELCHVCYILSFPSFFYFQIVLPCLKPRSHKFCFALRTILYTNVIDFNYETKKKNNEIRQTKKSITKRCFVHFNTKPIFSIIV